MKLALLSIAASIALSFATPLTGRDTCRPNFEGNAQTIYRSPGRNWINEWTPDIRNGGHVTITGRYFEDAFATGEFLVPFTGTASGTYQFKAAADSARQFALQGASDGSLVFRPILYSFPNKQEFAIACTTCTAPGSGSPRIFQSYCTVKHVATGKCVTGYLDQVTLTLKTCDGSASQSYIFASGPSA